MHACSGCRAAPEILLGGHSCTRAVDFYSFGIVLWELVTGERPQRGQMRLPQVQEECPPEVTDLIQRCAAVDPTARPSAEQLLRELAALSHGNPPHQPADGLPFATRRPRDRRGGA